MKKIYDVLYAVLRGNKEQQINPTKPETAEVDGDVVVYNGKEYQLLGTEGGVPGYQAIILRLATNNGVLELYTSSSRAT